MYHERCAFAFSIPVFKPQPEYQSEQRNAAPDALGYSGAPLVNSRQEDVVNSGVNEQQYQRNKPDNEQTESNFFHNRGQNMCQLVPMANDEASLVV